MNDYEFVKEIRNDIIAHYLKDCCDMFKNTDIKDATDPYWQTALKFFAELDDSQKQILFRIIRQVTVDTTATLFAVLDGVTAPLGGYKGDFELLVDGTNIAGDLADIFLAAEEEEGA